VEYLQRDGEKDNTSDDAGRFLLSGSTFVPLVGKRKEHRKVYLNELLSAAWMFAYASQTEHPFISVGNIYGKPRSVRKRGAAVRLTVPSETPGHSSHDFDWERVPIALTKHRMVLAYGPYTTLSSHGHKLKLYFFYWTLIHGPYSYQVQQQQCRV